jgi:hypothetical protein
MASNESGEFEVYVRPFPDVEQGGRQQVSIRGGEGPQWSPDGRELFYLSAQRQLMSIAASDDPSAQAEIVVVLNWPEELQRLVPSER